MAEAIKINSSLSYLRQVQFNRVCKLIDQKISNWRSKGDKEAFLARFSIENWQAEKIFTKERKKGHSLSDCKVCSKFNSKYQATFPLKTA